MAGLPSEERIKIQITTSVLQVIIAEN